MKKNMFTVLFLCSGNTCRSPMAELLLKDKLLPRKMPVKVCSAGLYAQPGDGLSAGARSALRGRGIGADGFSASLFSGQSADEADLILTMTGEHLRALVLSWPSARVKAHVLGDFCARRGDVPDPFGGNAAEYEDCCRQLDGLLDVVVEKLAVLTGDVG